MGIRVWWVKNPPLQNDFIVRKSNIHTFNVNIYHFLKYIYYSYVEMFIYNYDKQ